MSTKQPVSDRKLQANRANAQKSTGPRTPEGKARSSQNARTHGLLARRFIPANDPTEDPAEFEAFIDGLIAVYQPTDLVEHLCVKRIACCYWRLDRAHRFEAQCILSAREWVAHDQLGAYGRSLAGIPQPDASQFILPDPNGMNILVRYEQMIDRERL